MASAIQHRTALAIAASVVTVAVASVVAIAAITGAGPDKSTASHNTPSSSSSSAPTASPSPSTTSHGDNPRPTPSNGIPTNGTGDMNRDKQARSGDTSGTTSNHQAPSNSTVPSPTSTAQAPGGTPQNGTEGQRLRHGQHGHGHGHEHGRHGMGVEDGK
ncbi:hypothetical protein ACWIGX_28120 [Streptomyces nigrescens]